MTPEIPAEIIDLMKGGLSFEKIAPRVGISKSTLYNHADTLRAAFAVERVSKQDDN